MSKPYDFVKLRAVAEQVEILADGLQVSVPNAAVFTNYQSGDSPLAWEMLNNIYVPRDVDMAEIPLLRLPRGTVLHANSDFAISVDGAAVAEQYPVHFPKNRKQVGSVIANAQPTQTIAEDVFLLARYGISTWGHWLGELLPKAVLTEARHPGRFKYVVPEGVITQQEKFEWKMVRESLAAYGFGEDRFLPVDADCNYSFESLYAIESVWSEGLIHPVATELMRNGIPRSGRKDLPSRLAVSRISNFSRAIENRVEIETELAARGFTPLAVGALPFLEQVELFRGAETIFAVLGSDLANLIYAPRGVKVITVAPDKYGDNFFYALIVDRAGSLIDLRGPATQLVEGRPDGWADAFHVDLKDVQKAVDLFGVGVIDSRRDIPAALIAGTVQNDVLIGHNGYLFPAQGDDAEQLAKWHEWEIDVASFAAFRQNLEQRIAWATKNDAQFLQVIIPDRPSIIPEVWPFQPPLKIGEQYLLKTSDLANHILYPNDILSRQKEKVVTQVNSGLEDFGFILVAAAIVERLTGETQDDVCDELLGYVRRHGTSPGDLGDYFSPPRLDSDYWFDCESPGPVFSADVIEGEIGGVNLMFNARPLYPQRVLVFGDAFGRDVARILRYWFSEVHFFRSDFFQEEIADLCKPDFAMAVFTERYMGDNSLDAERPNFLAYAVDGLLQLPLEEGFEKALNAVLCFPRVPYQDFIGDLQSTGKYHFKLGEGVSPGTLRLFDSLPLIDWPEELVLERILEAPGFADIRQPAFVEDLSGRNIAFGLPFAGPVHGSYLTLREGVLLFGQSYLVSQQGFWSCETRSHKPVYIGLARSGEFPGTTPIIEPGETGLTIRTSHFRHGEVKPVHEPVFLATPLEPGTWGRWIATVTPKIAQFHELGAGRKFFCMAQYPWQRKFLNLFGLADEIILDHHPGRTYLCDDVMTVEYSDADLVISADERLIFADLAVKHWVSGKRNRRIFISRKSISERHPHYRVLQNETELADALAKRGFSVIDPETLSIEMQIDLYASAEYVVSLGGSALFNTAFCAPGTKVVTIESSEIFIPTHARFLSSVGMEYGVVFGRKDPSDPEKAHGRWTIDVDRACSAIEKFMP